jgi:hypothetical protein
MRNYRWISTLALVGVLSVVACGESGDADSEAAGYGTEQEQGTAANDTSPHRPGTPGQQP